MLRSAEDHPNIVKFLGQCEDCSIITERVELGDIRQLIHTNPDKFTNLNRIIYYEYLIANAMEYLEKCGIIHGHLSPRSCLITAKFNLKLASPRGPNLHAQLRYSAPEAIIMNNWSHQTDCWSFGILSWELLNFCTKLPFQTLTNAQIVENSEKILESDPEAIYLNFHKSSHIPADIQQLLRQCWSPDPNQRLSFKNIQKFFANKNSE